MNKKAPFVLATAVLLAGCNATQPLARRPTAADDPTVACYAAWKGSPEFAGLAPKVGDVQDPNAATIQMLSSTERASDADKVLIQRWAEMRQNCHKSGEAFRQAYAPPALRLVLDEGNGAVLIAMSKLYAGDYTYGQFNIERKRIRAEYSNRAEAARQQEMRQIASNQQVDEARRAQASAEVTNALLLMQAGRAAPIAAPVAPALPTVCTSRRIFNQVETTCR